MHKKIQSKVMTLFMLLTLFAQTLSPVVTVFAEDTSSDQKVIEQSTTSDLQTFNESVVDISTEQSEVQTTDSTEAPSSTSASSQIEEQETEESTTSIESESSVTETTQVTEESQTVPSETDSTSEEQAKTLVEANNREPQDIRPLLEEDDFFVLPIKIKLGDKEIVVSDDMEPIELKKDDVFQIGYSWAIPEYLDGKLVAGDWYEEALPSGLKKVNGQGELIDENKRVFGTYLFADGKLRLEFNELVETETGIQGVVWYVQILTDEGDGGSGEISIPINGETIKVPIFMQPNGGTSISKAVKTDTQTPGVIDWEVSINTNLQPLVKPKVTEALPETLRFSQVKIYRQIVNAKGVVTGQIEPALVEGTDYTVDVSGNVEFIGEYQNTRESFKLIYQTPIIDEKIPAEGGRVSFKNTATLTTETTSAVSASATTTRDYGKFLEKTGKASSSGPREFDWEIKFNYGEKDLAPGTWLTDTLEGTDSSIIANSIKVSDDKGQPLNIEYSVSSPNDQSFTITFPDGVPRNKVLITYKTRYDAIIPNEGNPVMKNNVTTNVSSGNTTPGGGSTNLGTSGSVGIGEQGLAKSGNINYNTRKVNWTMDINKGQYTMYNWKLTDTFSANQTYDDNLIIKEFGANTPLVKNQDYTLAVTANGFEIAFIEDRATKGTDKRYTITYSTTFDPRTLDGKLTNTASHTWEDSQGKEYSRKQVVTLTSKKEYISNVTKSGSYNATTKEITWTITANYMQDELVNAVITDLITNNPKQEYIPGSAILQRMTINANGNVSLKELVDITGTITEPTAANRELRVPLPNGSNAYRLIFKTKLGDRVIEKGEEIKNTANYINDGKTLTADASVQPAHAGNHLSKTGTPDGLNYAKWRIELNKTQSTLNNVVIVDKPSANLVIDLDSLNVFKTTFDGNNQLQQTSETLTRGTDYTVDLVTDNETGAQTLTLKFKKLTTAYIIEYRTLVLPMKEGVNQEASNNVSIEGEGTIPVEDNKAEQVIVPISGGKASSAAGRLLLKKTDATNQQPLEGVTFELWTVNGDNKKVTRLRSGQTDAKGELLFGGLRTNTNYLIIEKETVDGYVIDAAFKEGKILKIPNDPSDANKPVEFVREVTNDTFEVSFTKVAKAEQGLTAVTLAGAEFILQRQSDNQYYQGNQQGIADESNWVTSKQEATIFTSDKDGVVKVKGLVEGDYTFIETKAPTGYELSDPATEVPFKIVSKNNQLTLEKALTPIENTRQKVAINVTKNWENENSSFETRPEQVEVQLIRKLGTKEESGPSFGIANQFLTKANNWQVTFDNLVQFADNGEEYRYSVKEIDVDDRYAHDASQDVQVKPDSNDIEVTNRLKTIDISGEKIWNDYGENEHSDLETRPSMIKIQLMQIIDGKEVAVKDKTDQPVIIDVEPDKDNRWSFVFGKLPAINQAGEEIDYSVSEVAFDIEGEDQYQSEVTKNEDGTFTITNTYLNTEQLMVEGEKVWNDFDNRFNLRPEAITVRLWQIEKDHQTGKYEDSAAVELAQQVVKADENSQWNYQFTQLPKYDERGGRYQYFVTEDNVPGYMTNIDSKSGVITNTLDTTQVIVTKAWSDFDNKFSLRPESIKVNLLQNGEIIEVVPTATVKADESGEWSYTFTDLPKYDATGKAYLYTVEEEKVPGYTTSIVSPLNEVEGESRFAIVNTLETTEVAITKAWSDFDNKFSLRPESIKVNLLQNGEIIEAVPTATVTADESGEWSYTFTDLPKFDASGKAYLYTVEEEKVPGYTTSIASPLNEVEGESRFAIVNTLETTEVAITKAWSDFDNKFGLRPESIKVNLLQNGEIIKEVPTATVTADESGDWYYTFTDLPKYDATDKAYLYTVEEEKVPGYATSIASLLNEEEGESRFAIVNTLETTEVTITKAWSDFDNKFGLRPETIKINLLQDDEIIKEVPTATVKADESGDWSYTFTDLPKYDATGEAYLYTVEEEKVPGYATSIASPLNDVYGESRFMIVNTLETTEVAITKGWSDFDNKFNLRPESIKVNLLQDGEAIEAVPTATVTADESGEWSYTFTDLPKYDATGKAYVYTVNEEAVPGYATTIVSPLNEEEGETRFAIINTLETVDVPVTKVWSDFNNEYKLRPESIMVHLLQNGEELTQVSKAEISEDENGNWSYVFANLPKVDQDGEPYRYSIKEEAVPGYTTDIDQATGVITNTLITTQLTGQKIWKDDNDAAGLRPDSITVNLLQNGKKLAETIVESDEESQWNFTFENLPVYDQTGTEFDYTITENEVKGYVGQVEGMTITNTVIPKEVPSKPDKLGKTEKPTDSKTDRLPQLGEEVYPIVTALGVILVASSGVLLYMKRRKKRL